MRGSIVLYIAAAAVLLLFGLINYWVGLRGWQLLASHIPFLGARKYWTVFWLVAVSYLAGRLGGGFLPAVFSRWLTVLGSYWLAAFYYLVLSLALMEIVLLAGKITGIVPLGLAGSPKASLAVGLVVFLGVGCTVVYGWWNALHPRVVHYEVNIPKQAGGLKGLHVVAVSDLHLGIIVTNNRLLQMVGMVHDLKPDLVLLPGDVIDENPGPFAEQEMGFSFRRLAPKYGIYAVPGNHEHYGREWDQIATHMREAGINVLRDAFVRVGDSFYLVGREDLSRGRVESEGRRDLGDLMKGFDRSLPVILMDHQPVDLDSSREQGVDLMLSGHTHLGQMFPNNLITRKIYEVDWGYLRKESLQVIVSCGFGTWGPPIRVGNRPEIVDIQINFAPEGPGQSQ